MTRQDLSYYLIRILTYPLQYLPYRMIRIIAKGIGLALFYLLSSFRKRTLSNLALAKELNLSYQEIITTAKKSFQNLAITLLEYPRLYRDNKLEKIIDCDSEKIKNLYNNGKGIIFFCGHQANWEILFLYGTLIMQGMAIAKPVKNKKLDSWLTSIREKNGGKIVDFKNALKESIKYLRKGSFVGILNDQSMPESSFSLPFFGREVKVSTAAALLSYKTEAPILVVSTERTRKGYKINYCDPIFPNKKVPREMEVKRLMIESFKFFQISIKERPHELLWQHNYWKQQSPKAIKKRYREDTIAIVLSQEGFNQIIPHLKTFKEIYPTEFLFLFVPEKYKDYKLIGAERTFSYNTLKDILIEDFRFKLIFNLTPYKRIKRHFKRLGAQEVIDLETLKREAQKTSPQINLDNFSLVLKSVICRNG